MKGTTPSAEARLDDLEHRVGALEDRLRRHRRGVCPVARSVRPASVTLTGDAEETALAVVDAVGPREALRLASALLIVCESIGGDAA